MNLQLSDPQVALLRETLEAVVSDLSVEIADTDRKAYRDEIRARRDMLREILAGLGASASGSRPDPSLRR